MVSILDCGVDWTLGTCADCALPSAILLPIERIAIGQFPEHFVNGHPASLCPECLGKTRLGLPEVFRGLEVVLPMATAMARYDMQLDPTVTCWAYATGAMKQAALRSFTGFIYFLGGKVQASALPERNKDSWPQFNAYPDASGNDEAGVIAYLGADVFRTGVTKAAVAIRWSPFRPYAPPVFEIRGALQGDVPQQDLELLTHARKIFLERDLTKTGRKTGSRDRDRDFYLSALVRMLHDRKGRPPRQEDFLREVFKGQSIQSSRGTLRDNLEADGLWPWSIFVDEGVKRYRQECAA